MLNMIKMDLYRLFKTKSTYVIWIIMTCMLIISSISLKMVEDNTDLKEVMNEVMAEESVNIGMQVVLPESQESGITVYDVMYANIQGKVIALFIVIFAVLFSTADLNSGYIKNIGGQVKKRGNLILSKAVAISVYTVFTMVLAVLVQTIANEIFLGYIKWGNIGDFSLYLMTETFLHFAFACICMTVAVVIRNNVVSMVFAVCMSMNVMTVLYSLIQKIITKLGIKDFEIIDYTITGKISMLSNQVTSKESVSAICLSIVFIIIMVMIGKITFEKKDI